MVKIRRGRLRKKRQEKRQEPTKEEVVAVEHWLHSFDDLIIEELFLGEDKQLLE